MMKAKISLHVLLHICIQNYGSSDKTKSTFFWKILTEFSINANFPIAQSKEFYSDGIGKEIKLILDSVMN